MKRIVSQPTVIPAKGMILLGAIFLMGCGGGGGTAGIRLSTTALSFSNQSMGTTSAPQSVIIFDTGTAALNITAISTGAPFAQSSNCPSLLPAGMSCIVNVSFTPRTAGTQTGRLTIADDAAGNMQTVNLSGNTGSGNGGATVTLSPTLLTFPSQTVGTTSAPQTVTLSNSGSAAVSISGISASASFAQTNNCPSTLAVGGNCQINVTSTPTAAGNVTGALSVADNASGSPQTVSLAGTGVAASSSVTLSPTSLTFPNQTVGTTSAPQSVTLSNSGSATVSISAIGATAPFTQSNSCPSTLAPEGNCQINVSFTPTAAGNVTGALSVADNASGSPQTVSLAGTGVAVGASATLSPTSLTFPNQTVATTSAPQTITLSSTGTAALAITSITITGTNSSDFGQTNNCGSSVAAGANCTISVTFTPSALGARTAAVTFSDNASNSPQGVGLAGTGALLSVVTVLTNRMDDTNQGDLYEASLKAAGGTPPYTWSISSGQLPRGLQLDSTTGALSGTISAAGSFSFQVQVEDSASSKANKTFSIIVGNPLDPYGGTPALPCPSAAPSYFSTQKIANRWWLCTPAGNAFWMQSVYGVDLNDKSDSAGTTSAEAAQAKYGDTNVTWGPQQNRRLLAWGFNSQAESSSAWVNATQTDSSWPNGTQPIPMPFVGLMDASLNTLTNKKGYAGQPVKDLVNGILPSVYPGYRAPSPDIWDPNYQMWIDNCLQQDPTVTEWLGGPNNSYFIGFNVDDIGHMLGFGAGADFEGVVDGALNSGYAEPNLAWLVLVTSPTQTSNSPHNVTYSNTTVYSKRALANFLRQEYGTVAALNLAWGAAYTTFGQGTGPLAGTGLMDEIGLNPWIPKDYINLSDAVPALQQDLNNFLLAYMSKYFSMIKGEIKLRAPGRLYLGPTTLGSWGAPPRQQVLQAASGYLDIFMASSIPAGVSDDQQRMDFIQQYLGDKPWLECEGFVANPDSDLAAYSPGAIVPAPSSTQAQRGAQFTNMISLLLNAQTTSGTYPVVGYKWWRFMDDPGEAMNWGLVSIHDNEYDALAATPGQGADAWGFPTGSESSRYGDFLDSVISANEGILPYLLSKSW